ncbi:MAG: aminopeptidase P family protein [Bryobacterales bacterium]|nr:aminopeptidase P family protein [Bryobacterales bacterium]
MPSLPVLLLLAALSVSHSEYQQRRTRLRQALPNSAIVLLGSPDTSSDPRSPMLQEPNFYYLTGWAEPNAVLLILPESAEPNEILFLPSHNERKERYEGRRAAAGDNGVEALTGISRILSADIWESEVRRLAADLPKLHTLTQTSSAGTVKRVLPSAEWADAAPAISRLRMTKSPREVDMLQRSIDVSIEAHLAAWKRAKPGLFEYQIAATMTDVILERGCERHAYRPVIGAGPDSAILHYSAIRRHMDRGELLLMDVGAECACYAADITRTIPVGGRFNARQRELYEAVLGAQKAAIAAVKPGESLGPRGAIHQAARDYMDQHGPQINGQPLSKYFTHGIGHHVGLEVHDAATPGEPLEPGMVITIEPGVYIPAENIGIRIEDMVLVTARGARVLSSALPRDPSEIERRLAK